MDKGKRGVFGDGKSRYNTKKKRAGDIWRKNFSLRKSVAL